MEEDASQLSAGQLEVVLSGNRRHFIAAEFNI